MTTFNFFGHDESAKEGLSSLQAIGRLLLLEEWAVVSPCVRVSAVGLALSLVALGGCADQRPIPESCSRTESWVRDVEASAEKALAMPSPSNFAKSFHSSILSDMEQYPDCFDPALIDNYRAWLG